VQQLAVWIDVVFRRRVQFGKNVDPDVPGVACKPIVPDFFIKKRELSGDA